MILAAALAACGAPAEKSDWERKHESELKPAAEALVLPPYPPRGEKIEFYVAASSTLRFFVDAASISLGGDGEVRYVLVARSPAGVDNISFEGIRCGAREVRIYAVGGEGAWAGKPGEWRSIEPRSVQRWHNALYREYFCPQGEPIRSAPEGVQALRLGGHPLTKTLGEDSRYPIRR